MGKQNRAANAANRKSKKATAKRPQKAAAGTRGLVKAASQRPNPGYPARPITKIRTITEFFRLLKKAVHNYGYQLKLVKVNRLLPKDDPIDFVCTPILAVRFTVAGCTRELYPVEAVWHCFYRKGRDPDHVPGPGYAGHEMGMNMIRVGMLQSAGEMYNNYDKEVRKYLLKACGKKRQTKTKKLQSR